MAKVEWVKIYTDMFDNKKIKYIRSLPEGNNILLIWVMLITMAGSCNENGYIFLTENIPYTPELLAKELGFEINTVRFALSSLQNLNMINVSQENLIYICGWCEYQNIEGMDKIRLQNAARQARFREKKKAIQLEIVDGQASEVILIPENSVSNSNVTVTLSNETEEDKEKRKKNKKENKKKEVEEIIKHLNLRCNTSFKPSTKTTETIIVARLEDGFSLEQLKAVIDVKAKEWINNKEFAKYLRPSTLFTPKHCEDYLNQAIREGEYKDGECNTKPVGTVLKGTQEEDDVERALRKQGKSVTDLKESTDYDF